MTDATSTATAVNIVVISGIVNVTVIIAAAVVVDIIVTCVIIFTAVGD